jgi:hypothetical protein
VDRVEGRLTVFTYDTTHQILSDPSERPDGRMFVPRADGGTEPTTGLDEAYRIMEGSTARNRLVLVLTDGDWFDADEAKARIAATNALGVFTALALLGFTLTEHAQYGQRMTQTIRKPGELAEMFRAIVTEMVEAQ